MDLIILQPQPSILICILDEWDNIHKLFDEEFGTPEGWMELKNAL